MVSVLSVFILMCSFTQTRATNGMLRRIMQALSLKSHSIPNYSNMSRKISNFTDTFNLRKNLQIYRSNMQKKVEISNCIREMSEWTIGEEPLTHIDVKRFCSRYNYPKLLASEDGYVNIKAVDIDTKEKIRVKLTERKTIVLCIEKNRHRGTESNAKYKLKYVQIRTCGTWNSIDNLEKIEKEYINELPQTLDIFVLKKLTLHYKGENRVTPEFLNQHRMWTSGYTVLVTKRYNDFRNLNRKIGILSNKNHEDLNITEDAIKESLLIRNLINIIDKFIALGMFPLDLSPSNLLINKEGYLLLKELDKVDLNYEGIYVSVPLNIYFPGNFSVGWQSRPCIDLFPPEIYHKLVLPYCNCTQHCGKYIPDKFLSYQIGSIVTFVNHGGDDQNSQRDPKMFYDRYDIIMSQIQDEVLKISGGELFDHIDFINKTMALHDTKRIGIREVLAHSYLGLTNDQLPKHIQ